MITTIIVNYHSYGLTARAAASVLADQPDAQVIVIDNSEDEFEAKALCAAVDPRVECIINSENTGFGRACNLGYEHARHDLILLLNPDAMLLEGCTAALVDFLHRTPKAGAVSPKVFWDDQKQWLLPPAQLPTPSTELGLALALRKPWFGKLVSKGFQYWALRCLGSTAAVRQRMLSGGCMLLKRSAIEAAGGLFDPVFFMYYEDTDLCLRLQKSGFALYLLPAAQAVHKWCAGSNKNTLMQTSRQLYFNKHFSDSRVLSWLYSLEQNSPSLHLPESRHIGLCTDPKALPLPEGMSTGTPVALSPHPLFIPAIYYIGKSNCLIINNKLWQRLGTGRYWLRIGTDPSISWDQQEMP
ncbi:MAG: glycosyltransferase family 2 protein [Desulfuromonas sp.]|nr:glycosyltransferase family 2 protein [Desulfuromonas sp.]